MTDRELERRLADAVTCAAPDDLEAILSRCGAQNGSVMELKELKSNENIIEVEVTEVKPRRKLRPWLAAACAALVLLGAGGGGLFYYQSYAVASVVSLDVNPSIELKVNRAERVISCTALNTEAAAVLFDMNGGADLKGTKLDVAVNAIVGALVREGYLDSISSAILISVEDKDQGRAARLQAELVASVDGVLQTQAPGTSVLSQVLDTDAPALEYMTFDSGLSAGKSALVYKVMEMNGTLATNSTQAFDQLAALSVEELNDLLKTGARQIPIGKSAAAAAAEEYAGTLAMDSVTADVDPDLDEVPAHYDVELRTAWGEFDYMVDAFTGAILSGQKDILNAGIQAPDTQAPEVNIPAANTNPGVQTPDTSTQTPSINTQVPNTNTQTPNTNTQTPNTNTQTPNTNTQTPNTGTQTPNTNTQTPNTGTQTPSTNTQVPSVNTQTPGTTDVGRDAAKAAALKHAGLSESQVTNIWVKQDWDDGRLEYDVEFWCGTTEYDYTIDGVSCAVLKHECDYHDDHYSSSHHSNGYTDIGTSTNTGSSDIGQAAAKAAALKHAGLSESQTTWMKVERDWDDGRLEYEVDFRSGRMEYEYTIDGTTGAILKYESDWDD